MATWQAPLPGLDEHSSEVFCLAAGRQVDAKASEGHLAATVESFRAQR